ncbi:hypothetical protein MO867_06660 [Microbulbifer sp. OS29]|uniref:FimV N-terminal domain-containing protein n=1 Tax=Microbulbifer okhotskensis TaxID=2926617 RepID=A0A9X2J5W9_9GAMM|nr:FimV/HubP family polar landmark protein [Microbulbifer okhotskensis]MCO1334020.1 hypothetical protein [Microbulbifer okhotskensis]
MRVRKLALAVGLVGALGSNAALALGLGEIKLNSTLNQPLDAEIGLLQTRGLDGAEIKVRLAGPQEFDRAGVERSYLLASLSFDVDYSGSNPVIRISSREPIREPFLNFLVETRWPSGRLLREYTLLMDLPAFSPNVAQQPVRAAERERQQVRRNTPVQQPAQPVVPASRPVPTKPVAEKNAVETVEPARPQPRYTATDSAETSSQVYGPVGSSDTLWEIALQNRANRDFSVQQTMLAIQRLNPEAFINNNINLLKKGAVLRLPSNEDLRSLTMTEAISEVAQQNDSWRQSPDDEVATGAPLDARAIEDEPAVSETLEGRVSLAAPGDNESLTSGSGIGSEEGEALEGDLIVAEEELDKSKLENTELRERIAELDEQIDTMETLVEVSSEEMSAVQAVARQANSQLDPIEVDELAAEPSLDDSLVVGGDEELDGLGDNEIDIEEAETPAATVESRNRVVSVQTKPKLTLMEQLGNNTQLIGIGAAGLLAGVFGFFTWRRRKAAQEAEQQLEQQMVAEQAPLDFLEEIAEPDETLAAVESMEADDTFDLGDLSDVGTDDPISEAEIHLSLGQYEEAESKLLQGLERDPQVVDARLMLMEVYAHNQDVEKFDDHYRQLLSISDGPVADRAARLRETLAGAPEFEAPSMGFSNESLEAAQLHDIGSTLDDDFTSAEPALENFDDVPEVDTSLLDDLTMDLSLDDEETSSLGNSESELSLDLDLDSSFNEPLQSAQQEASLDTEFNLDDLDLDSALDGGDEATAEEQQPEIGNDLNLDDLDLGELDLGDLGANNQGSVLVEDDLEWDLSADKDDSAEAPIEFDASELDLASLDLDAEMADSNSVASEAQPEKKISTSGGSIAGLDFELDLSMMEESKPEPEEESLAELDSALELESIDSDPIAETPSTGGDAVEFLETSEELSLDDFSEGDLDMIGGDLGSDLDLDGIDLDDIAADLTVDEEISAAVEPAQASESAEDLPLDTDLELDFASLDATGKELVEDGSLAFNADSIEEEFSLEDELALIDESTEGELTLEQEPAMESELETVEQVEAIVEKPADSDFGDLDFNLASDLNSELSLLEGGDEMATKLELAQAYMDMGDEEGAKDILKEVAQDGGGEHKGRAEEMLEGMV